ncbi:MAG: hypothetical protein Q9191_006112 [Dirinaria sp. TL-2023a]
MMNFPGLDPELATNCHYVEVSGVPLTDLRGNEHQFSIDECGFKVCKNEFKNALTRDQFNDPREKGGLVKGYLQETVEIVKKDLQADKTICFDWRLRSNDPADTNPEIPLDDIANARSYTLNPAGTVHCDYTYDSGLEQVYTYCTAKEREEFEQGTWRIRLINFWRPLKVVQDAPLALCDRRTVNLQDYIYVDGILPDKVEEEIFLRHTEKEKWYWLSDQSPHEQHLFVLWDSCRDGLGSCSVYSPRRRTS